MKNKDQNYLYIGDAGTFRVIVSYYTENTGHIEILPARYLGEEMKAPLFSVYFEEDDPPADDIVSLWIMEQEDRANIENAIKSIGEELENLAH